MPASCSSRFRGCCASPTNSIEQRSLRLFAVWLPLRGVRLEGGATTGLALAAYENGAADFSDFFILESARRGGALPLHTFDERLSRVDGAKLVE